MKNKKKELKFDVHMNTRSVRGQKNVKELAFMNLQSISGNHQLSTDYSCLLTNGLLTIN